MTQIVLTSGTSWAVPGDYVVSGSKIEAIGGGAGGSAGLNGGGGGSSADFGGAGANGIIVINYTPGGTPATLMGQAWS